MTKTVYEKYCNDIQNPALGAAIIAIFINEFYKHSINQENPPLLMIFVIIPLILNEKFRKLLIKTNGRKSSLEPITFLSKIVRDDATSNNLHHYVEIFKSYTLTSMVFAIKMGIVEITSEAKVVCATTKMDKFPVDNLYLKAAKILGEYFANGVTLQLMQQKLEVLF
jgi:hypothetical protein